MISIVRERLKSYNAKKVECASTILAGVVIPLFEKDGDFFLLLTKRSDKVRFHKGEVSFPGGMYEETDGDILNTALRECSEEIGVKRDDVEIIGRLDDVYTLTGFVITPYVGIIPYPYEFRTNPEEVAYIITLPYTYLKEANPAEEVARHDGQLQKMQSIHYNGDRIWGATSRILLQFQRIIENGSRGS
jgi:8-oxo-dGTP pyrophosphatase MutT (NUDIX family)